MNNDSRCIGSYSIRILSFFFFFSTAVQVTHYYNSGAHSNVVFNRLRGNAIRRLRPAVTRARQKKTHKSRSPTNASCNIVF